MQSYSTPVRYKGSSTQTPIYAGEVVIGYVKGDTIYKAISAKKHFLRRPPAIMFDILSIKDAENAGALYIQVTDRDTDTRYTAAISRIWEKPIYKDYGFGRQVGLCLKEWTVNGMPPVQPKPKAKPAARIGQMSLF